MSTVYFYRSVCVYKRQKQRTTDLVYYLYTKHYVPLTVFLHKTGCYRVIQRLLDMEGTNYSKKPCKSLSHVMVLIK